MTGITAEDYIAAHIVPLWREARTEREWRRIIEKTIDAMFNANTIGSTDDYLTVVILAEERMSMP
jgi:hypothetical protein